MFAKFLASWVRLPSSSYIRKVKCKLVFVYTYNNRIVCLTHTHTHQTHMTPRRVVTDYVAWKGRYCAFDYDQFEHFLNYVFAQTMQKTMLPQPDPWEGSTNADGIGEIWSKLIFDTYTEVIASRLTIRSYLCEHRC